MGIATVRSLLIILLVSLELHNSKVLDYSGTPDSGRHQMKPSDTVAIRPSGFYQPRVGVRGCSA